MVKKKSIKKKIPRKEILKQIDDFIMKLPPEYLDDLIERTQSLLDDATHHNLNNDDDD